jgi:hypothetical protein
MRTSLSVLFLCTALGACSSRPRPYTAEQKAELARYVGTAATAPGHPLNIKFGDAVTLVGYDLGDEPITPGKPFKVTWHFKVDKAVESGFALFTHLTDGVGTDRVNGDAMGALRGFYPPSRWEPGSYVRDPQEFTLPEDWDSDRVTVYLGFWKEDRRLAVTGSSDGHDRARALSAPVRLGPSSQRELHATRSVGPITLDGKLDEPVWADAARSSAFVNTISGGHAEPEASVRAAWDDKNLYVAFEVADDYLHSTFTADGEHLWEQDCVEIMLDPGGDGKDYVEVQVSPANKHFDTKYDTRRVPGPIGHAEFDPHMESGVVLRGTLNDDDKDSGYTVELSLPWASLEMGPSTVPPAAKGGSLRVNFYVLDARAKGQRAVGWSPVRVGDFHVPDRFGTLVLD